MNTFSNSDFNAFKLFKLICGVCDKFSFKSQTNEGSTKISKSEYSVHDESDISKEGRGGGGENGHQGMICQHVYIDLTFLAAIEHRWPNYMRSWTHHGIIMV